MYLIDTSVLIDFLKAKETLQSKKFEEIGTDYKHYRFVIARKIRAIFEIKDGELVLKIRKRKDVY